jgi:hypothetical protein
MPLTRFQNGLSLVTQNPVCVTVSVIIMMFDTSNQNNTVTTNTLSLIAISICHFNVSFPVVMNTVLCCLSHHGQVPRNACIISLAYGSGYCI